MTTILFMPDDRTLVTLESDLSSQELILAVENGSWKPPEPYASLVSGKQVRMRSIHQGQRVVIIADTPLTRQAGQEISFKERRLSPRQAQVLQGLIKGLTTKQIAYQLGLKPRTVKMHVAALKNRFGASTRAQSVGIAARLGLLEKQENSDS